MSGGAARLSMTRSLGPQAATATASPRDGKLRSVVPAILAWMAVAGLPPPETAQVAIMVEVIGEAAGLREEVARAVGFVSGCTPIEERRELVEALHECRADPGCVAARAN